MVRSYISGTSSTRRVGSLFLCRPTRFLFIFFFFDFQLPLTRLFGHHLLRLFRYFLPLSKILPSLYFFPPFFIYISAQLVSKLHLAYYFVRCCCCYLFGLLSENETDTSRTAVIYNRHSILYIFHLIFLLGGWPLLVLVVWASESNIINKEKEKKKKESLTYQMIFQRTRRPLYRTCSSSFSHSWGSSWLVVRLRPFRDLSPQSVTTKKKRGT